MKALILAGGRGKRLNPFSKSTNKCMFNILGKPLIEYSLDCASKLEEIDEIVIVVGYKTKDVVRRYDGEYKGKRIKYVVQKRRKGLVHAIETAKGALTGEDFILMLADEFMANPHHRRFLDKFENENLFGLCGTVAVADRGLVKKTYAVIQNEEGKILRLIEKPNNPANNIMGTGNCIFKNRILSYIPHTPINQKRGEKELPDLIQCAIDDACIIKSFIICEKYVNVNSVQELKEAQSYFAHL